MSSSNNLLSLELNCFIHSKVENFVTENIKHLRCSENLCPLVVNSMEMTINDYIINLLQQCQEIMQKKKSPEYEIKESVKGATYVVELYKSILCEKFKFNNVSLHDDTSRSGNFHYVADPLGCFVNNHSSHITIIVTAWKCDSYWSNTIPKINVPQQSSMQRLWMAASGHNMTGIEPDIEVEVGSEVFYAHKLVLKLNSTYFKSATNSSFKESNNQLDKTKIKIRDISSEVFRIVLKSLYDQITEEDIPKEFQEIFSLLQAAEFFDAKALKDICIGLLSNRVINNQGVINCSWSDEEFACLFEAAQSSNIKNFMEICLWAAEQRPQDMKKLESLITKEVDWRAVNNCIKGRVVYFPNVARLLLEKVESCSARALK